MADQDVDDWRHMAAEMIAMLATSAVDILTKREQAPYNHDEPPKWAQNEYLAFRQAPYFSHPIAAGGEPEDDSWRERIVVQEVGDSQWSKHYREVSSSPEPFGSSPAFYPYRRLV